MKIKQAMVLLFAVAAIAILATAALPQPSTSRRNHLLTKVLVQGCPMHGANGIRFDSAGLLYIANCFGNEIVVMNPSNGKILNTLGAEKGVISPDDLAFGPDGSLYWTSLFTGYVGRLSPNGSVKTQFVKLGVNPITFTPGGRLFVGLCFLGDGLFELDPALDSPPVEKTKNPGMLNGFDFGPDGLLYSPLPLEGRVVRMNVNTDPVAYETILDGQPAPAAVKFDPQELYLYGHNQTSGEVWRLDPATKVKETVSYVTPGTDNLAFNPHGRLFVSHAHDGTIFEILPSGHPRTVSRGGMIAPGGVAILPSSHGGERVFVADLWTMREFNGLTGRPGVVERFLFDHPEGITAPLTVSSDGANLVVSSYINNNVQVWDPETQQVVENRADVVVPLNAIRFQGDLAVAELGTGQVVRLTPGGRVTLATGLYVPSGLAAAGDNLWVADWATGIVWQINAGGPLVPVAFGLKSPEGLAVDLDGNLLVVESGAGRLSQIDLSTGNVSAISEGLALGLPDLSGIMSPTNIFNGVAVGPSGAIYVTGDKANVLYRLRFPR
jgi:sugar lactone lactonase YvrE